MHPSKFQPEAASQGFGQGGFAHARQVFQQQVPPGQDASKGQADLVFLAQQHLAEPAGGDGQGVGHLDLDV